MTAPVAVRLRRRLADELASTGKLHDPRWRKAVESVPREVFLGPAVYRQVPNEPGPVWTPSARRDLGDEAWLSLAYTDETWVTQVEGLLAEDAADGRRVTGSPTSSSSLPGLVVQMLEWAQVGDGDRVLEIGTGTGYSTALMSYRLGGGNVTSVEVDPEIAARAAAAIGKAGYSPNLVVGDGLAGHTPNAPYDRLIATCAVRYVPPQWVSQVREGGTILVTLSGWMTASGLVRLTVNGDGTAEGRLLPGYTSYMMARPHGRPPRNHLYMLPGDERESRIDPNTLGDWTGRFVAQLAAPSAELMGAGDEQILYDVATGSQARTAPRADGGGWTVQQRGPLRLWDAVEGAIEAWQCGGAPHQSGFGLTVTPRGQRVWLGEPDGPGWVLPL